MPFKRAHDDVVIFNSQYLAPCAVLQHLADRDCFAARHSLIRRQRRGGRRRRIQQRDVGRPAAVMKAAYRAATTTGMIVLCAHVLAYFLVMTQVTEALLNWLKGAGVPRWGILIILSALKQQQQLLAIVFSSPAAPSSAPAPHR